jgi:hypothetical protein
MNLLYGTKHAGYNWQPNHCADFAQPVGAPCLQMMLTTLSVSVWVVRTALITMPRKQGKTELAATLALYHLLGDDEKGGQVYSAATDRYQVALVFNAFEPFLETKN